MLKMFIVHAPHLRSAVADLSADRQPHMLFWCHTCAKSAMGLQAALSPFVNLRSAHLFLRYAYRSGTISALLSAQSRTIQATSTDISAWCLKIAYLRRLRSNRQKIHKIHRLVKSPYHYHHRVSCSVFLFSKIFFSHSSF